MEDRYDKLTCPDGSNDDLSLAAYQEEQQVSLSMVRSDAYVNHQKRLAVLLSILAGLLLSVSIGLGMYYRTLTDGERIIKDIQAEIAKFQQAYKAAINSKLEFSKILVDDARIQQQTKWDLDHQGSINAAYQNELDKILSLNAGLKSHILLLEDGCRHCLPRWNFIKDKCYYIPFSDDMQLRRWEESREYCKNFGADLTEINSREEQLAINDLITTNHNQQQTTHGYWIGARDEEEGMWRWLDGRPVVESFWNIGEPNDVGDEDCAGIFPKPNKSPYKDWNDVPCSSHLKWICEKEPNLAQ
ncbi:unnamed protein product [Knipowitschia caucasica]|uniref:C-type lectin domain-containing protein n=1 Tax=Knipowitschia caucasica TaxID=637954 RepID=A0AAV2JHT0_KNICA